MKQMLLRRKGKALFSRFISLMQIAVLVLSFGGCVAGGPGDFEVKGLEGEAPENWPSDMPEDILPLPGTLDTVWPAHRYIRMFYSDVSRETVIAYANAMKGNGFECEYIIFTYDEKDHGKIVYGRDFNAVTLKKGEYDFLLEVYADNEATYSLSGLPEGTGINSLKWPEEWADLVPRPEGVDFSETFNLSYDDNSFYANGVFSFREFVDEHFTEKHLEINRAVVRDYIDLLFSIGYREATELEKQAEGFWGFGGNQVLISNEAILSVSSENDVQYSNAFRIEAKKTRERAPAQNHSPYTTDQVEKLLLHAFYRNYISHDEYQELLVLFVDGDIDNILNHRGVQNALLDDDILENSGIKERDPSEQNYLPPKPF